MMITATATTVAIRRVGQPCHARACAPRLSRRSFATAALCFGRRRSDRRQSSASSPQSTKLPPPPSSSSRCDSISPKAKVLRWSDGGFPCCGQVPARLGSFRPSLLLQEFRECQLQRLESATAAASASANAAAATGSGSPDVEGVALADYFFGLGLDDLMQRLGDGDAGRKGTLPAKKEAMEAMPMVEVTAGHSVSASAAA